MNHEAELAQLLIRTGTERGVDIETILAELSWAQFPSFIDAGAVRESLMDAVESWWRADLENRINELRNQFVGGSTGPVAAAPVYESPSDVMQTVPTDAAPVFEAAAPDPEPLVVEAAVEPRPDATVEGLAVELTAPEGPAEAMPSDATMIWNTRGG